MKKLSISKQIKTMRHAMEMSQEALAQEAGLKRQQIADWETNRGRPLAEDYLKIMAVYLCHESKKAA